jgi:high-affinity iron transporter
MAGVRGLSAEPVVAPQPSPQLIETGKAAYQERCVTCHGATGEGNGPAGAYLTPRPRNFKAEEFKRGSKPEQAYGTITDGIPNTAMPSFASLSPEERWALAYYVLSLKAK